MSKETVAAILSVLDKGSLICFALIGLFAIVKPKKAWELTRSKKNLNKEGTQKSFNATRLFGVFILIMASIALVEMFI